jgi:PST family polysaccharide transporter
VNPVWINYLPISIRSKLDGRFSLQKILANLSWLFADRVLRMGIGLILGVWVARYLGPDRFGLLSYATAFVALFGVFGNLGLDGIVVRDLVREPSQKDAILGAAFAIKSAGSAVTSVLAVAAIFFLRPSETPVHGIVAIIAIGTILQAFDVIDFWFQSRVDSRWVIVARNVAFVIISAIKIVLIVARAPLIAFAVAGSLELLLVAAGLIVAYRANGNSISRWTIPAKLVRQFLSETWPLAVAAMAVMVYMRIDQIMLGQMLGNRAVGMYSAAVRVSEIWYFIPVAIVASVSPSLVEAKRKDTGLYYNRLSRLFRLMVGIAVAIAVPMTFLAGTVANVLYGNDYEGVGPVLAIHIWTALFVFLGVAQSPWTINESLTKLALMRTCIGALVNVLLNLVLIPARGPVGAAIATMVSQALSAVFLNAFSSKTRKILRLQLSAMLPLLIRR